MKRLSKGARIGLVLVVVVFLVFCWVLGVRSQQPQLTREEASASFMEGCREELQAYDNVSGIEDYCRCAFDDLYSRLGAKGFEDMSIEYKRTGVLPVSVNASIDKCQSFIHVKG